MSDEQKGAKEPESLNGKSDGANPPGEGKSQQKTSEELLSEYKAESARKAEEIKSLKAEKANSQKELQELREKEQRQGLSGREERLAESLEKEIELAAEKIRNQDDTKPWIKIAKDEAREEAFMALNNYKIELANEFMEDSASELGMEPTELAKELLPYALKYSGESPLTRNRRALRDYKAAEAKNKDIEAKEKKLKELEEREKSFREGAGRIPRVSTKDDKFDEADKRGRLQMARDLIG